MRDFGVSTINPLSPFTYSDTNCLFNNICSICDEFFNLKLSRAGLGFSVKTRTTPAGNDIIKFPVIFTEHLKQNIAATKHVVKLNMTRIITRTLLVYIKMQILKEILFRINKNCSKCNTISISKLFKQTLLKNESII